MEIITKTIKFRQGGGDTVPSDLRAMATQTESFRPNTGRSDLNIVYAEAYFEMEVEAGMVPLWVVYYDGRIDRTEIEICRAPDGSVWTSMTHGYRMVEIEGGIDPFAISSGELVSHVSYDACQGTGRTHYEVVEKFDPEPILRQAEASELNFARACVISHKWKLLPEEEREQIFQQKLEEGRVTGEFRAPSRYDMCLYPGKKNPAFIPETISLADAIYVLSGGTAHSGDEYGPVTCKGDDQEAVLRRAQIKASLTGKLQYVAPFQGSAKGSFLIVERASENTIEVTPDGRDHAKLVALARQAIFLAEVRFEVAKAKKYAEAGDEQVVVMLHENELVPEGHISPYVVQGSHPWASELSVLVRFGTPKPKDE